MWYLALHWQNHMTGNFFLLTIVTTDELSSYIYIFTQKSQISLNDREQQDRLFSFHSQRWQISMSFLIFFNSSNPTFHFKFNSTLLWIIIIESHFFHYSHMYFLHFFPIFAADSLSMFSKVWWKGKWYFCNLIMSFIF